MTAGETEVEGFLSPFGPGRAFRYFALVQDQPCCLGCLPRDPERRIEVFSSSPIAATGRRIRLRGVLNRLDDESGWRLQLRDARLVGVTRRAMVASALAVAACAPVAAQPIPDEAAARAAIADMATVDIHSHAGRAIGVERVRQRAAFSPLAAPMRDGGMAVVCLAMVADSPVHHVTPEGRIRPFRDPAPGELAAYGELSFQRLHDLAAAQRLPLVTDAVSLAATRADRPGIVIAAEGADFLEGDIDRLDAAHRRWSLRHLQLTHYRPNELGDIQTEPPVHGGLTPFGAAVIRRCNRLGIVVDVAHGTLDLVRQAAAVTTKPLVLSHTSLSRAPGRNSRQITADHARVIAGTGGVIGIWPPVTIFPDMAALAAGVGRMVDAVGIDHVGLGSDMNGLVSGSAFPSYRQLPALAAALLARGFGRDDVRKLLGGNYLRVFTRSLA